MKTLPTIYSSSFIYYVLFWKKSLSDLCEIIIHFWILGSILLLLFTSSPHPWRKGNLCPDWESNPQGSPCTLFIFLRVGLFPEYPLSQVKALRNPSWTPGPFPEEASWQRLDSSLPGALGSEKQPALLCVFRLRSLHSPSFSLSWSRRQMPRKENRCQVWILPMGLSYHLAL